MVKACPCGKTPLTTPRSQCMDSIPTCGSTCGHEHGTCGHPCLAPCHAGECPPCSAQISVPCRCGEIVREVSCSVRQLQVLQDDGEITCESKCTGVRHCGRHSCNRICCPLAAHGRQAKKKGKKRYLGSLIDAATLEAEDVEGWHVCDLVNHPRLVGLCDIC